MNMLLNVLECSRFSFRHFPFYRRLDSLKIEVIVLPTSQRTKVKDTIQFMQLRLPIDSQTNVYLTYKHRNQQVINKRRSDDVNVLDYYSYLEKEMGKTNLYLNHILSNK